MRYTYILTHIYLHIRMYHVDGVNSCVKEQTYLLHSLSLSMSLIVSMIARRIVKTLRNLPLTKTFKKSQKIAICSDPYIFSWRQNIWAKLKYFN